MILSNRFLTIFYIVVILVLLNFLNLYSQQGWINIQTGSNNDFNNSYFFDQNTGIVVGGFPNSTLILRTTNGGSSWNSFNPGLQGGFWTVVFPNNGSIGYVAGGYYPHSNIMKSTNFGINWTNIPNPYTCCLYSMSCKNVNSAYIVGDWGKIIRSTDGGNNWYQLPSCSGEYLESLFFVDSLIGYSAGRAGQIIKTTDAGNSWFFCVNSGTYLSSINFLNKDTGFVAGKSGLIMRTFNGGLTWNSINPVYSPMPEYRYVKFHNHYTGYVTGTGGTIIKTTNAGQTWTKQTTPTTNIISSIFWVDLNKAYATGYSGTVLYTATGGESIFVPQLIYPPNGSNNIPLNPGMTWTSGNDIISYKIEISTVSNFQIIVDSATVLTNQYLVPLGKLNQLTTYHWRVKSNSSNFGYSPWSDVWTFGTTTDITKLGTNIPDKFKLYNNFPNPFNPSTNIKFDISELTDITILVYNSTGILVEELYSGNVSPGVFQFNWNASKYSSGIYYLKLNSEKFNSVIKMLYIK